MKKIDGKTSDLIAENIEKLKQLFPEIWEEGKVDLEMLKKILGEKVETDRERYSFSWHGKSDAIKMALKQSTGTLRPKKVESKDWNKTNNLYIEGDNLEVLRVLQDSYRGKVKMIYIDPPYNTGKDFVYEDNFADNIQNYKEKVGDTMKANADSSGRKHTNWLNMMYPRLRLARNLLKDDGVIFISIDDNEQANLKKVCDEIFGEENFIINICHKSRASVSNDKIISPNHNHILLYSKNIENIFNNRHLFGLEPNLGGFNLSDERGEYKLVPVDGPGGAKKGNPYFNFLGISGYWRFSEDTMKRMYSEGLIVKKENSLQQKYYKDDAIRTRKNVTSWWDEKFYTSGATKRLKELMGGNYFDNPKPVELIVKMLKLHVRSNNDIVLDFFSGSSTTAHAVMQLNAEDGGSRKFVMVQLPEATPEDSEARKAGYKNICEIGKERIRRAGEKIVKELREQQEKKQEKLIEGDKKVANPEDLDIGFKVFELDETNFTKWDPNTQDVEKSMMDQLTPIKADRADEDAVYEIMLKYGVDLTMPIEELMLAGKKVFSLAGNYLLLCLEKQIGLETVGEMAKLSPHRAVFYDDGFADDTVKANAEQTLKKAGIEEILVI